MTNVTSIKMQSHDNYSSNNNNNKIRKNSKVTNSLPLLIAYRSLRWQTDRSKMVPKGRQSSGCCHSGTRDLDLEELCREASNVPDQFNTIA